MLFEFSQNITIARPTVMSFNARVLVKGGCTFGEICNVVQRQKALTFLTGVWGEWTIRMTASMYSDNKFRSSYHSEQDRRLPIKFYCAECRLRGNLGFSLIAGRFDEILTNFSETATFRLVWLSWQPLLTLT